MHFYNLYNICNRFSLPVFYIISERNKKLCFFSRRCDLFSRKYAIHFVLSWYEKEQQEHYAKCFLCVCGKKEIDTHLEQHEGG